MKAILVVDVPIEMLNDNTCATITSFDSGMSFNAKLKPLPKRKVCFATRVLERKHIMKKVSM